MTAVLTALWILAATSFACSPQLEDRAEPIAPASKVRKRKPPKSPSPAPSAEPTPSERHDLPTAVVTPSPAWGSAELVRMSWYTMGTRTANGESVQPGAHNCAGAARYPMGSHVRVRNPGNDRVVIVRINDRGGFEAMGRALDCMPAVWHTLGFNTDAGVVTVEARQAA